MIEKMAQKLICTFFIFLTFTVYSQTWCRKADFPGGGQRNAAGFSIGGKGYVCYGYDNTTNSNQLWEFDPIANTWAQKTIFPGAARRNGIGFSIGNDGYVGLGFNGSTTYNSIYKYSISTNTWTTIATYPGNGGRGSQAASFNGKGYVFSGGTLTGGPYAEFYEYDPSTNAWTALSGFPLVARTGGSAITLGNYIYFGFGHNNINDFKDFWRYDPSNNTWLQMPDLPGLGRFHPQEFTADGRIIIGGGYRLGTAITLNDYYAFDPITNTWSSISGYTNDRRSASATFSIGGFGYLVAGRGNTNNSLSDTWEYGIRKNHSFTDTIICDNSTLLLDATAAGGTYLWQDNSTLSTFTITQTGIYWVDITVNGCTTRDSINVTYFSPPVVDLGNDTSLCAGETLLLDATTTGGSYIWKNNSTIVTQTITQAGIYWVDVTVNGCTTRDSIIVTYFPSPIVNLGNDTSFCDNTTFNLDATTAGGTYLWQDNSTLGTYNVTQSGVYWVDVTVNNCTTRDSIKVDFFNSNSINLGNDTSLCDNESILLDVSINGASYLWNNNSTLGAQVITNAGLYWVEITVNGCTARDSIVLTYFPNPNVNLGNDTSFCDNSSLNLDVTTTGGSYLWQDNSTFGTYTVTQKGVYWVDLTVNGCTSRDSIKVDYIDYPIIDMKDTILCLGDKLVLNVYIEGSQYLWQDGSRDSKFTVSSEGNFSVIVSNECGAVSDTAVISYTDCECNCFIPNIFTPNNDGINELFGTSINCSIENFEMLIFNRWGENIFRTNSQYIYWDGTFKGRMSQTGTYYYIVKYINPFTLEYLDFAGSVTLLR